jgi:RNA polymerase sigma factor (sigma-70 family)
VGSNPTPSANFLSGPRRAPRRDVLSFAEFAPGAPWTQIVVPRSPTFLSGFRFGGCYKLPMTTDGELLQRYEEIRSEDAFAELLRRHLDLVYSAALRQVNGDTHLAQDVVQKVFTDLARKAASLSHRSALTGWLYMSTHFAAAKAVRSERRRHAREQEAHTMRELLHESPPNVEWDKLRPILDSAMLDLKEPDRDAILLRFFENRPLADIGSKLGLSEDAARKKVDRAVEKLRTLLARRGITTAAVALGSVLSANAVHVAPAGLAATLRNTSLTATAMTSSTVGIFTFMTATKLAMILGATAVLLIIGGTAVKTHRSAASRGNFASAASETLTQDTSHERPRDPLTQTVAASADENELNLAAALRRVQEILNSPRPGLNGPNPAMVAAIAALGDRRHAAVAMLRESLKNADPRVRRQAAEGLALIGPEAKEAIPDLMEMLRTSDRNPQADQSLRALKEIGASSEILPSLADILKENPASRHGIAEAVPQMFSGEASAVDQAFRPLLQNEELDVRRAAAYSLALVLGNQSGPDVIAVALEALRASSENLLPNAVTPDDKSARVQDLLNKNLLNEALGTLVKAGADPNDPLGRVTAANLGPAAAEATSVLAQIAMRSTNEGLDVREAALRLLDSLNPDIQNMDPVAADLLKSYRQTSTFVQRANDNEATLPELINGLQQFPNESTLVATASALGRLGPEAQPALSALREALAAFEPKDGAMRSESFRIREAIANAIQKIIPDQPKPLFTISDIIAVHWILFDDPALQSDAARRQRISAAVQPVMSAGPGRGIELNPEQMHRLLVSLKGVDQPAYDAVVTQVKRIDPQFATN